MDDMDIIEANEAFASPCLSFSNAFGYAYDDPRINPTGGAIGLGHPIGASGVVYFGEMAHHLKRTVGKAGIQMMRSPSPLSPPPRGCVVIPKIVRFLFVMPDPQSS